MSANSDAMSKAFFKCAEEGDRIDDDLSKIVDDLRGKINPNIWMKLEMISKRLTEFSDDIINHLEAFDLTIGHMEREINDNLVDISRLKAKITKLEREITTLEFQALSVEEIAGAW